jgi:hypothetical protein
LVILTSKNDQIISEIGISIITDKAYGYSQTKNTKKPAELLAFQLIN